jgi:predicted metalloprotease with PDZ domain
MGFRTGGIIGTRELPGPLAFQVGPQGDLPFNPPMMIHGPLADMELVTLTPQLGRYFGTDKGVLVVRASREQGYQLEDGDVILAIDGRQPTSGSHATRILNSYQPGEKIAIKLMRQHKMVNVEATLPDRLEPEHKVRLMRNDDAPT